MSGALRQPQGEWGPKAQVQKGANMSDGILRPRGSGVYTTSMHTCEVRQIIEAIAQHKRASEGMPEGWLGQFKIPVSH